MNYEGFDALDDVRRELKSVRRQLRVQQWCGAALAAFLVLAVVIGASPVTRDNVSFDRITARHIGIVNDDGKLVVQLDAADGGGAVLLRGSDGREAVQLFAGPERNEIIVNNRGSDVAAAIQGLDHEGRLSLHRTFANRDAAEAGLAPEKLHEYLSKGDGKPVTVPTVRLPARDR